MAEPAPTTGRKASLLNPPHTRNVRRLTLAFRGTNTPRNYCYRRMVRSDFLPNEPTGTNPYVPTVRNMCTSHVGVTTY